jgi:ADP-dependent NAD(P)H-hydrate dehydratase / NAD(P)H-hydrate epimerase
MKILSAAQIRQADAYTIAHEPIASIDLMELASEAFVDAFLRLFPMESKVRVICGRGNNGGDGLAIARLLHNSFFEVRVDVLSFDDGASPDFTVNLKRLPETVDLHLIRKADQLAETDHQLIVDAMFGSGLNRALEGPYSEVIQKINNWPAKKVAVDIASGLFADTCSKGNTVLKVDYTISFQSPKLAFLMPENAPYVGDWQLVDIGLDAGFIERLPSTYFYITQKKAKHLLPIPKIFDHKGSNGRALLIAGSYGKMGAAVLATRACVRMGAGLNYVMVPGIGYQILQLGVPEAMVFVAEDKHWLSGAIPDGNWNAIGIGPGIGTELPTQLLVANLIMNATGPLVLDADALNCMAIQPELKEMIPENSILTPHTGEFKRLAGGWENDFEKLELQKNFSVRNKVIVILKGAFTSLSLPDGNIWFNSTGNPGMAKGGSGDVLTGILTALLAKGLSPEHAALLGVFLHGRSGDIGRRKKGVHCLIPSDIIHFLPKAIKSLLKN